MLIAFAVLLPMSSAFLERRVLDDPTSDYLSYMCLPLFSNLTRTRELDTSVVGRITNLAKSPYPCEQSMYLQAICTANGTQEVDFLAEQECLCNGNFFKATAGCDACYLVHGFPNVTKEEAQSSLTSRSLAECTPSPPF